MSKTELIGGMHAVESALRNDPERVSQVLIRQGRQDRRLEAVEALAKEQGVKVLTLATAEFTKRAGDIRHQGVLAVYQGIEALSENDLFGLLDDLDMAPFLLILDGVTDPHNLGACLRTAEAAGVHVVIVPKDNAVSINATVRKVASGAAEVMPFVQVTNLARTLDSLRERGVWVVGTTDKADKSLYEIDLKGPLAVIMGAEGKGMRRLTEERCDYLASLPMAGQVSSLNISVATGVCLYEAVRQRS